MNHPFFDGNKRTGYGAMMMYLSRNGYTIKAPTDEHVSTFLSLAAGELDREEFLAWIRDRMVRKAPRESRANLARRDAVPIALRPNRADRPVPVPGPT